MERGDSYRVAMLDSETNGGATATTAKKKQPLRRPHPNKLQDDVNQELEMDEHRISVDDLCRRYEVSLNHGLTSAQVQDRRKRDGPNELSRPSSMPGWVNFIMQLFADNMFSILLLIVIVMCFINYFIIAFQYENAPREDFYLGISLLVALLVLAAFSFYHKRKTDKILNDIRKLAPQQVLVLRDGKKMYIDSPSLVAGDVIEVKYGDIVPADFRIIRCSNFKVDSSVLTGETEPQSRSTEYTHENPLESKNLAFYSMSVVDGSAVGIVVNTGDRTVLGRISNLVSEMEVHDVPLAQELSQLTGITTGIGVALGVVFFIVTLLLGYQWLESIVIFIGVVVACVPGGLHPSVAVCLTLIARRMAQRNCLVRNLHAVENLGCVTAICTDKTGTLTLNRMTVAHLWFDLHLHTMDSGEYPPPHSPTTNSFRDSATWPSLARAALLCNRAEFHADQDAIPIVRRECTGDATDAALLRCVYIGLGTAACADMRRTHPRIFEIPFNPQNKHTVSVHDTMSVDGDPRYLMVMKGAPERIFSRCATVLVNGTEQLVDSEFWDNFARAAEQMGAAGERIIGFCDIRLPEKAFPRDHPFEDNAVNIPLEGLRFLGLLSMIDPPRAGVQEAVAKCRGAGIRVIMFTGDHPITAQSIAKSVGIISEGHKTADDVALERGILAVDVNPAEVSAHVIHGSDLREMLPHEVDRLLQGHSELVFARTSPNQKLQIVEGLQRAGHLVAATGNAVQDCLALSEAHVGVAMAVTGSDVSRRAADVLLLDNSFTSLVAGIEEGRLAFDNLKKSVAYTLATNTAELLPFLLFILADIPLPLGTIAILCIDVGTDLFPAISLAHEGPESDLMKRRPRHPTRDRLVNERLIAVAYGHIGMLEAAAGLFSYLVVMTENGFWPARLPGLRKEWDSMAVNDLMDSYGQEWSFHQRKCLDYTCYAAYLVAMVVVQWGALLAHKTRRNSIFQEGLWNHQLTLALFWETTLAAFLVYVPAVNYGLHLQPLRFTWWLAPMPFAFLILHYDEVRKLFLRQYPGSWLERETYY